MSKPYIETTDKVERTTLRLFKNEIQSEELVWHRDKENRVIWSEGKTDWKFQFENEIPEALPEEQLFGIYIPKYTYHRLIKGRGDLNLNIVKVDY